MNKNWLNYMGSKIYNLAQILTITLLKRSENRRHFKSQWHHLISKDLGVERTLWKDPILLTQLFCNLESFSSGLGDPQGMRISEDQTQVHHVMISLFHGPYLYLISCFFIYYRFKIMLSSQKVAKIVMWIEHFMQLLFILKKAHSEAGSKPGKLRIELWRTFQNSGSFFQNLKIFLNMCNHDYIKCQQMLYILLNFISFCML